MGVSRAGIAAVLLLVVSSSVYAQAAPAARKVQPADGKGVAVEGKVVFPPDGPPPAKFRLLLAVHGGAPRVAFVKQDGSFSIQDVPVGTHLLDISVLGLVYPQLRVEATPTRVIVSYAEDPLRVLPHPLMIMPVMRAQYFDEQKPFNIINLLKSPYGLMAAFMIFGIFVLPKMKVDPEEYKEMMEASGLSGNKARPQLKASGSGSKRD